jgi:hypothetical protein
MELELEELKLSWSKKYMESNTEAQFISTCSICGQSKHNCYCPNVQLGSYSFEVEEEEDSYTIEIDITESDLRYFRHLDKFGEVGLKLFESLLEDEDFGLENIDLAETDLTQHQQDILDRILTDIEQTDERMSEKLEDMSDSELREQIAEELWMYDISSEDIKEHCEIKKLEGVIVLLFKNSEFFNNLYHSNLEDGKGFYHPSSEDILFIDKTNKNWKSTLKHEYLHFLNRNFIEHHEEIDVEPKVERLQKEITNIESELEGLKQEEELAFDAQDLRRIRDEIGRKKENMGLEEKNKKLKQLKLESNYYSSEKAIKLFNRIRDEISAYALGREIVTKPSSILPLSYSSIEEAIQKEQINSKDATKIKKQWKKVRTMLSFCRKMNVDPEEIAKVGVTSQNLEIISKRLLVLIEDND